MKAKWYISTLFLLFIFFGAFQEQVLIPNQEITLEFVDTEINKIAVEKTIAAVKEKLLEVGVENIKIKKTQNGTLKISYYSVFHVDNIKEELSKKNKIVLNTNSDHKEKNKTSSNYNIDIYELTNESDISNLDYKFVFEVKYNADRFTTDHYNAFIKKIAQYKAEQLYRTTFKVHKNNPFTKDKTSYKVPEVRAGPKSLHI